MSLDSAISAWRGAAIGALLRRDVVRLVGLTGPGGVGTTRLALRVATELRPDFAAFVASVPLAPLGDATLVAAAVVEALGVQEVRGPRLVERIKAILRDRRLLLVLDNFELVAAAAPVATDLRRRRRRPPGRSPCRPVHPERRDRVT